MLVNYLADFRRVWALSGISGSMGSDQSEFQDLNVAAIFRKPIDKITLFGCPS